MLLRGSKVFECFLDVRKTFDTVWIDGLRFKLFSEFGIKGRMWLVIRNLYTGVKAQVLCSGSLLRKFDILQGTGKGRILAPYKMYVNGLLNELTHHSCILSLNSISLISPSFADDISLLSLLPYFSQLSHKSLLKWRYAFNHVQRVVLLHLVSPSFKSMYSETMKERNWVLGCESATELYEYKNIGVVKNYIGSFSTNADDNMHKTWKKSRYIIFFEL